MARTEDGDIEGGLLSEEVVIDEPTEVLAPVGTAIDLLTRGETRYPREDGEREEAQDQRRQEPGQGPRAQRRPPLVPGVSACKMLIGFRCIFTRRSLSGRRRFLLKGIPDQS